MTVKTLFDELPRFSALFVLVSAAIGAISGVAVRDNQNGQTQHDLKAATEQLQKVNDHLTTEDQEIQTGSSRILALESRVTSIEADRAKRHDESVQWQIKIAADLAAVKTAVELETSQLNRPRL
jgi:hypothetical protein